MARVLCVLAVLAGALVVAGAGSAQATKAPACWKKLINDWYDNGRIDGSYEAACYKSAIKHLPRDVRNYSDAYEVMSRALASALQKKDSNDKTVIPPPAAPPSNGGGGNSGNGSPPADSGGATGGATHGPKPGGRPASSEGGVDLLSGDLDAVGSSDTADSVPVPLLVLAGLALLLVAAGAAGLIARRVQARRSHP